MDSPIEDWGGGAPPAPSSSSRAGSGDGLDVAEYVRALLRFWWLIVLATAVGLGLAILYTTQQTPVYEASCVIEYDPRPTSPLGREVEDVADPFGNYWASREFFTTQNRIISSRLVAERVVRQLSLHLDPGFMQVPDEEVESFRGVDVDVAARRLQGRITVEPVEDTRLVQILVSDADPERAATIANTIAREYIDKTMEDRLSSTVRALDYLGSQLANLRTELDESELALHRFKQEHNILSVSLEDRQNLVSAEIQSFNEALTSARTRRIELAAHMARLRHLTEADTLEEQAAGFQESDTIGNLRAELRGKLAEQEGLRTRYGPSHQRMQTLQAEIDDLRRQLGDEIEGLVRAAEADVVEVRRIENGLRSALADANQAGLELNLREIEYQRLNRERENNTKLYSLVLERSTETDLTRMLRTTHARLLDEALPGAPLSSGMSRNATSGLAGGLILGLALALLLGRLDRRIKGVSEAEGMGVTILGVLPRIDGKSTATPAGRGRRRRRRDVDREAPRDGRDLFVHTHPMSAAAECLRTIRTNITFMAADEPMRTMLLTSASPREGKTTVSTNLAISLAQSGKTVLLVDTDMRRPRIHRALADVANTRGVSTVVVGEDTIDDVVVETEIENLFVMPCGPVPPNPSELLHTKGFAQLIEDAKARFDRVIFDSPPLGAVTDAAVLATQVDAVVVVLKAESTTRDALRSTLRQLRDVRANLIGGVINELDTRRNRGYGGGYRYHYYYSRSEGYYTDPSEDDGPDGGPGDGGDGPAPRPGAEAAAT